MKENYIKRIIGMVYLIMPKVGTLDTKVNIIYKSHSMIPKIRTTNKNFFYNSGRYLFAGNAEKKSEIYNITDISCYQFKELCIVSGNRHIELYEISQDSISLKKSFVFKKTKRTLISLMKVITIPKTDFFLAGEYLIDGLMRWDLKNNAFYDKLTLENFPQFLSFSSIITFRTSSYGAATFRTYKKLVIFDYVKMTEIKNFKGFYGYLAHIDYQLSKNLLGIAEESNIRILNYETGLSLKYIRTDYYINDIKSVPKSGFLIITNGNFLRVYNIFSIPDLELVYSYNAKESLYSIDYNELNERIFFSGNSIAASIYIQNITLNLNLCNPLCKNCKNALSRFSCIDCSSIASKVEGACVEKEVEIPFGGRVDDFGKLEWSNEEFEGYIKGVTWSMLVYVILAIFLVIVLLVCLYFGYVHICHKGGGRRKYREV